MPQRGSHSLAFTLLTVCLAIIVPFWLTTPSGQVLRSRLPAAVTAHTDTLRNLVARRLASMTSSTAPAAAAAQAAAPVWFISHGGPPTMFQLDHPAYKEWEDFGRDIRDAHSKGQLKGLIAISAHWESDTPGAVEVNVDEQNPLVYDYYGFPDHYYKVKVASTNPRSFSSVVLSELNTAFSAQNASHGAKPAKKAIPVKRGLDHGVFVPLKVAFPTGQLPETLPLCQVTLPASSDIQSSLLLGQALRRLRTEHGVGIFAGGMGVHNMRDFGRYMALGGVGVDAPYAKSFLNALSEALAPPQQTLKGNSEEEGKEDLRWRVAREVGLRPDYKKAHPTPEHILPAFVALGATQPQESLRETFKLSEGPMGWSMYRTVDAA